MKIKGVRLKIGDSGRGWVSIYSEADHHQLNQTALGIDQTLFGSAEEVRAAVVALRDFAQKALDEDDQRRRELLASLQGVTP